MDQNRRATGGRQFGGEGIRLYELARGLANSRIWPAWNPDAEFKAVREETRGQRR